MKICFDSKSVSSFSGRLTDLLTVIGKFVLNTVIDLNEVTFVITKLVKNIK